LNFNCMGWKVHAVLHQMNSHLNLLHIVLALSAAACFYLSWRESSRRKVQPKMLLWPSWSGFVAALLLTFFQVGMKQPLWPFLVALLLGIAAGVARGFTMKLEVDEYGQVVRPPGVRVLVWVAGILVAAVAVDIAGAIAGSVGGMVRFPATLVGVVCAGFMFGRALVMAVRVWRLNS
jgi:hypothetical protein